MVEPCFSVCLASVLFSGDGAQFSLRNPPSPTVSLYVMCMLVQPDLQSLQRALSSGLPSGAGHLLPTGLSESC